ncbi:MAG: hypothetical protein Q7R34_14670 [Dehalococcoidia bacterium]|nr:hypothetical protein [Dehalococcoidia bacterium]
MPAWRFSGMKYDIAKNDHGTWDVCDLDTGGTLEGNFSTREEAEEWMIYFVDEE